MIDFQNAKFFKLNETSGTFDKLLEPMLADSEMIITTYQSLRDGVVFTNKRIFAINTQGIIGKKKDITSLPYSKIQAFSVETAGTFDIDSELELWFSGLGKITFEFLGRNNVTKICQIISQYTL
ncbi:MAG: PH domain-containing protein [Oscillospiraceae bacterium]